MDTDTLSKLVSDARKRQDRLLTKKGADYTRHDNDRLSNFKRTAVDVGLTPLKVWAVFAHKHWDAIMAYVKTGRVESEAIEGRLDDLANYIYLLEALLKEETGSQTAEPPPNDPEDGFYETLRIRPRPVGFHT